ncbi:MAG: MgtC/SapB family protein [Eubacteriales bacterium]
MIDPIASLLGDWATGLTPASIIFRALIAILFAAVIGCERAAKRHAAGLRTFMLVSLASAMAAMADEFVCVKFGADMALISAAALIGSAIISSNTILYSSKNQIKGLTTSVAPGGMRARIMVGAGLAPPQSSGSPRCSAASRCSRTSRYTSKTGRTTLRSTSN